ncbi:PRKR-interacting protein 1 homolog [Argonauta hians]
MAAEECNVVVPRTATELQKIKLEKLMKNPEKEIVIPDSSKEWVPKLPPEFIRNVWGSSAGAGSGDFHVYRGVRRREYARQKFISEKADKDSLDEIYHEKVLENQKAAEERTSKKRAKRQKKKMKKLAKKKKVENKSKQIDSLGNNSDEDSDCGSSSTED